MFQINQLKEKIVLDETIIESIRQNAKSVSIGTSAVSSHDEFARILEVYLNEHLRGIEFSLRKQIQATIIKRHLLESQDPCVTYYDIARVILEMPLPIQQTLKNFQSWILMSTEYALNHSETVAFCKNLDDETSERFQHETDVFEPELDDYSVEPLSLTALARPVENNINTISDVEIPERPFSSVLASLETHGKKYKIKYPVVLSYFIAMFLLALASRMIYTHYEVSKSIGFRDACFLLQATDTLPKPVIQHIRMNYQESKDGMPAYLAYQVYDLDRIRGYLKRANSLLANDPYFTEIIKSCERNDVNPLLLLAISGQEQGFVKRGSENAALIVNNPFNVYHSWVDYNTNISDASEIATITIRSILEKRPNATDSFKWLNQTYAEDPTWWQGVEQIYLTLENYMN